MEDFESLAPVDKEGGFYNEQITYLYEKNRLLDVARYNSYLPDYIIMNRIRENPNLAIYVAMMKGIVNLSTIANVKVFFCYIGESTESQQSHQNPSYNNKEQAKRHLPGRKVSD